jgi:maleylacetate reductase
VIAAPADVHARSWLLFAAYLAGSAMAEAGLGVHHRICHTLGGMHGLPHAELHAVLLPHTVASIEAMAPDVLSAVAETLGVESVGGFLFDLALRLGAPTSLRALGISPEQAQTALPQVLAAADGQPPGVLAAADIGRVLEGALAGRRPGC